MMHAHAERKGAPKRETKFVELDPQDLEVKEQEDGGMAISGFASVFGNVDSWNDIVMPGAFAKSLKGKRKPAMLWQHDAAQVIGVWDKLEERPKGLYVEGRLIDTAMGSDAYKLVKAGAVTGMSIGYMADKYEIDDAKGTRKLLQVTLYEVSLVTFPANERATVTGVKGGRPKTIREFETFLREEGGFSREDATTVAVRGFKALPDARDALEGEAEKELAELFGRFKA